MSKAFTKEDDDSGGFTKPPSSSLISVPAGHFRMTSTGARLAKEHADERVREALLRAEILPAVTATPHIAAIGVRVLVKSSAGVQRTYRLVSAEERALIGDGCSLEGPIGQALLGARVGDVREVALPQKVEELEIVALLGE